MKALSEIQFDCLNIIDDNNSRVMQSAYRRKTASIIILMLSSKGDLVGSIRVYHNQTTCAVIVRLWPSNRSFYAGIGTADGYGYDRASVALCKALESMGIDWNIELSGRGIDNDIIFKRLAESIGYRDNFVSIVHSGEF